MMKSCNFSSFVHKIHDFGVLVPKITIFCVQNRPNLAYFGSSRGPNFPKIRSEILEGGKLAPPGDGRHLTDFVAN